MPETALPSIVHLKAHADEPIRSLEAAAKFVRRHALENNASQVSGLLRDLEQAQRPHEIARATQAFRLWAASHGFLLIPPEDR